MIVALLMFVLGLVALFAPRFFGWVSDRLARGIDQPAGAAFNAQTLHHRMEAVRHDYLAELQARPPCPEFHEELIGLARRSVAQSAFFRPDTDGEPLAGFFRYPSN